MDEESVGPYRLESLIGEGGMGQVWRARDTRLGERVVALKVLSPGLAADPAFRERFTREADRAAGLRSPHIIPIHTYGEADGRLFIEMPLARGTDLDDLLARNGPLPPARAVHLVAQVARALDVAHDEGLVHRDVKPGNVLVDETADDFAYLVDFGIAKAVDGTTALTGTQGAIGSLPYMAPERLEGRPDDHRVDVYALGVVLFELLTGRRPFATGDVARAVYAHVHEPVPAVSAAAPGLPVAFDGVVRTAMAKDPLARYPSAGALAAEARRALDGAAGSPAAGPAAGTPPTDAPSGAVATTVPRQSSVPTGVPGAVEPAGADVGASRERRRWPWVAAAAAVVAVLAAGAVLVATGEDTVERPAPAVVAPIALNTSRDVPVGPRPQAVRTSPDGAEVYVVGRTGTLAVVRAGDLTPEALVALGEEAYDLAVHPGGRTLWVTTASGLAVVDVATRAVVRRIPVVGRTYGVAVSPDGAAVWVALPYENAVVPVAPATGAVGARVPVGDYPEAVAPAPAGDTVYVVNSRGGTLSVVESGATTTVAGPVGPRSRSAAVAPDGATVWVSSQDAGTVTVLDTESLAPVATVSGLPLAGELTFSPDGTRVFVRTSTGVAAIDAGSRVVTGRRTLPSPESVAAGPAGTHLYTVDDANGLLTVSSTAW